MGILREKRNHFVIVNFVYFECSCENASVDEVSCHCHTLFCIQITKINKKVAGLDRRENKRQDYRRQASKLRRNDCFDSVEVRWMLNLRNQFIGSHKIFYAVYG